MASGQALEVDGYHLELDRLYDPATHLWVQLFTDGRARVGFDPLGSETSGDIVAISLTAVGEHVERGGELGSIEAAKFVGPLASPLSGNVVAHNQQVLATPGALNADPMNSWIADIEISAAHELDVMLSAEAEIAAWFASEVARFRTQGAIAE